MPAGMEIDLGGVGKEYAVDRAALLLAAAAGTFLVNFGGDLFVSGPRAAAAPGAWASTTRAKDAPEL